MKRKQTTHIGFRIEDDVLERLDMLAESNGLKRTDVLKMFMRSITAKQGESLYDSMMIVEQLKHVQAVEDKAKVLHEQLKEMLSVTFDWHYTPTEEEIQMSHENEDDETPSN